MIDEVENAFRQTTKVVFSKELTSIVDYKKWLLENVMTEVNQESVFGEGTISMPPFLHFIRTKNYIITMDKALELGKKSISKSELENLTIYNAAKTLKNLKYYSPESAVGKNVQVYKACIYANSSFCYQAMYIAHSKFCAYSMWPRNSENIFGSTTVFSSKFCINCYYSVNLTRCFEVSNSSNCSDCYFSHNIENCQECMFCFNTKAKRYAIGNVQYPKEQYLKFKKKILDEIASKLQKDKKLDLSIFNIGAKGK